jgi:hypothetical protein
LASRPSARPGSVSIKRLDEPPDAGPHVRWCERGRGDPAPYSIPSKEKSSRTVIGRLPVDVLASTSPENETTSTKRWVR